MLKVKVKVKDKRFSIPVPYAVLNLVILIITSKGINRLINKELKRMTANSSSWKLKEKI
ncbi:hypothetical protein QNH48_27315 [Neobacillus sp. YX16]|uniref:hypothetical protein n=1 Tax=Neobacillus sp. YX16 TaxID=3047874 RepID=UPI0024C36880|nr:hypothetical protein [Neobacillus sp. YX16]WHZ02590.1 hypothetical protein QNH48_27315 [Neobacillus sp. YX16]